MAHKVNMHNEPGPVSQGGPSKERRIEDRPRNNDPSNSSSSTSGNGTHATSPFLDPPDSTPSQTHPLTTPIPLVLSPLPPTITACDFAYNPPLRFPHPLDLPPTTIKPRTLRSYQKALAAAARKKGIKSPRPVSPPPQATRKGLGQGTSAPIVPTSLLGQGGGEVGETEGKERGLRDVIVVAGRDTSSTEDGNVGMERGDGGSGEEGEGGVGGGNGGEAGRRRKRDRFADWVRRLY